MVDIGLFGAALYIVVYHGKDIADAFDSLCPNEEQMLEMMKKQE